MKTCQYFEVKVRWIFASLNKRCSRGVSIRLSLNFSSQHYEWRGLRETRGFRAKSRRIIKQFSPHDFTAFKWAGTHDFLHYATVVMLLAVFLAAELNPFYLKVREQRLIDGGCMTLLEVIIVDGA
jgi:hypothetical protein